MKHKSKKTSKTAFSCHAPDAEKVFLAGEFNGWSKDGTPMKKETSGKWSVKVALDPGKYQYKFVVDGEWCCAPACSGSHACPDCVVNEHGTMNRIITVS